MKFGYGIVAATERGRVRKGEYDSFMEDYLRHLIDPQAAKLRESTCSSLADALAATGAVLWAFGLAEQPRRAIATAIQIGGETARGAVTLLRDNNRYGAAALVRQIVEIEYLLFLFAQDTDEPLKWASCDLKAVREQYQPARMRERSGGQFRIEEYSSHCQVGGHPRYAGAYLLPEHIRPGPLSDEAVFAAGWVDLAQHLARVWRWIGQILSKYDLLEVGLANSSLARAYESITVWLREDFCAPLLNESEALLLKQAASTPPA